MIEDLARHLARKAFEFHAGPDEEWNERADFKVPISYYLMLAQAATEFIEEHNDPEQN